MDADMNQRTLSSSWTFFVKFVFPALLAGLLVLALGTIPMSAEGQGEFFAAGVLIVIFMLWLAGGLKRVRFDERSLYVSNYLDEFVVPLDMITEVTENRWLSHHPVTVYFREPMDFGDSITFSPKRRSIVAELKSLTGGSAPRP
jgi:Na+/melibiose symporter-like transporter